MGVLLAVLSLFSAGQAQASGGSSEPFVPGDFIFDHIGDAHEWHILTWGETHVSLPLPVIAYSEYSGLHVFMSSHFHHGHESHDGLGLREDGKLVEVFEGQELVEVLPRVGPELFRSMVTTEGQEPDAATVELIASFEAGEYEKVAAQVSSFEILPYDFSITKNVLALFVSIGLMMWLFIGMARRYQAAPDKAPTGFWNLLEPLVLFIRDDIGEASIGKAKSHKYVYFLLTVFFFIFINNLLGLVPIIPGGANVTGNIAVPLVLALFTFVITTFSSNKHYWMHIINTPGVPWWLKFPIPLMPVVEIMGVFIKPFVLMIRLFANITAGHIVLLGFFGLIFIFGDKFGPGAGYGVAPVSVAFTVFLYFLKFLVAFIQAYVFTLLSALYIGMASEEHEHHGEHEHGENLAHTH